MSKTVADHPSDGAQARDRLIGSRCIARLSLDQTWEPEKFATAREQQVMLDALIQWLRRYETRDVEYGLQYHRRIFTGFAGPKREYTTVTDYAEM